MMEGSPVLPDLKKILTIWMEVLDQSLYDVLCWVAGVEGFASSLYQCFRNSGIIVDTILQCAFSSFVLCNKEWPKCEAHFIATVKD